MSSEKMLVSQSETIGVPEIRNLMELTQTMGRVLTHDEYVEIASVYTKTIDRLLRENGEDGDAERN